MSNRIFKVQDLLHKEIAYLLIKDIQNPLISKTVTISGVRVSKDLKYSEVFFTSLINTNYKKIEDELNKLLKLIKKNKDYNVSTKDLILLESLISDGVVIKKKYLNMFNFDQSNIPTDIQLLLNNEEIGMVLLRLVEIIGEDNVENLDSDTLYFISSILNQLNLDTLRNKILLQVLPLKI